MRLEKDIPEKELAALIDKDISTYSRIEKGEIKLSKDKALLLANFFQIDVHEIFPENEGINIENSFHNSPSSNIINSTILPYILLDTFVEMHKELMTSNMQLFQLALENQKHILELLKSNRA